MKFADEINKRLQVANEIFQKISVLETEMQRLASQISQTYRVTLSYAQDKYPIEGTANRTYPALGEFKFYDYRNPTDLEESRFKEFLHQRCHLLDPIVTNLREADTNIGKLLFEIFELLYLYYITVFEESSTDKYAGFHVLFQKFLRTFPESLIVKCHIQIVPGREITGNLSNWGVELPNYLKSVITSFTTLDIGKPDILTFSKINLKVSIVDLVLAIYADNPNVLGAALEAISVSESVDIVDIISKNKLLFLAVGNNSISVIKFLLDKRANIEQKISTGTKPVQYEHTPLSYAISICPQLNNAKAKILISLLLDLGANCNYKLLKLSYEQRGYLGANTVEIKHKLSLFDYDTTGILLECTKSRKVNVHSNKQSPQNNALNRSEDADLYTRVKQLEELTQNMQREINELRKVIANSQIAQTELATIGNSQSSSTSNSQPAAWVKQADSVSKSTNLITLCKFYKSGVPGSCKKGDECTYLHDRSNSR